MEASSQFFFLVKITIASLAYKVDLKEIISGNFSNKILLNEKAILWWILLCGKQFHNEPSVPRWHEWSMFCICAGYFLAWIHSTPFSGCLWGMTHLESLWPSACPLSFCWRHQQKIREWKEKEVGVEGVLRTWHPEITIVLIAPGEAAPFIIFWAISSPQSLHPSPAPSDPGRDSLPPLPVPGCLINLLGSINCAHLSVKSTFIKCPWVKPLGLPLVSSQSHDW